MHLLVVRGCRIAASGLGAAVAARGLAVLAGWARAYTRDAHVT